MFGQVFERLTVIGEAGRDKRGERLWRCSCVCGGEKSTVGHKLRSGHTRSCGCLKLERAVEAGRSRRKHGGEGTPLYRIRSAFIDRCTNPRNQNYADYGGRGISVCSAWRERFEAFRDWALANGYRAGLSIDRIDNDGNYEPSNCRWATPAQQARNRRCVKLDDLKAAAIRKDPRRHRLIAAEYGISVGNVGSIKKGKLWAPIRPAKEDARHG